MSDNTAAVSLNCLINADFVGSVVASLSRIPCRIGNIADKQTEEVVAVLKGSSIVNKSLAT